MHGNRDEDIWAIEKLLAAETATLGVYAGVGGAAAGGLVGFAAGLAGGWVPITVIGLGIAVFGSDDAADQAGTAAVDAGPFSSPGTLGLVPANAMLFPQDRHLLASQAAGPFLDAFGNWGPSLGERVATVVNAMAAEPDHMTAVRNLPGALAPNRQGDRNSSNRNQGSSERGHERQAPLSTNAPGRGELPPQDHQKESPDNDKPSTSVNYGVRDSDPPAGYKVAHADGVFGYAPDMSRPERQLGNPHPEGWTGTKDHFEYHGGGDHQMHENIKDVRDYPDRSMPDHTKEVA